MIRFVVPMAVIVILAAIVIYNVRPKSAPTRTRRELEVEVDALHRLVEHIGMIADDAPQPDLTADMVLAQIRATHPFSIDPRFKEK